MAFVPPKDRVMETSISNSQTVFALAGAVDASFNRFSASMAVNDTTVGAVVEPGVAFKTGILTYSATNQVTIDSTGFESKGMFSSGGTKEVFMGLPAKSALMVDGAQSLTNTQKNQALANLGGVGSDAAQSLTSAQQNQFQRNAGIPVIMRSYLAGLTLSTAGSSGSFSVAAGVAADRINSDMMTLPGAIVKNTNSTFAAGSGSGGLDTGSMAANAWYHIFLIKRPDTGAVDVLFSLSVNAPTMPASYTMARRIGSLRTDGVQQWRKFTQFGDEFLWDAPITNVAFAGTTAIQSGVLLTPNGIRTRAIIAAGAVAPSSTAGQGRAYIFSPEVNLAGGVADADKFNVGGFTSAVGSQWWTSLIVRTGTGSNVYFSTEISSMTLYIITHGWIDTRGRDD